MTYTMLVRPQPFPSSKRGSQVPTVDLRRSSERSAVSSSMDQMYSSSRTSFLYDAATKESKPLLSLQSVNTRKSDRRGLGTQRALNTWRALWHNPAALLILS